MTASEIMHASETETPGEIRQAKPGEMLGEFSGEIPQAKSGQTSGEIGTSRKRNA